MRKLWLLFAQAVTVALAAAFVIGAVWPEYLPWRHTVVTLEQGNPPAPADAGAAATASLRYAARKAAPSVVNIYTSKRLPARRSPLLEDPLLRWFYGEPPGGAPPRAISLGSGVIVSASGYVLTNNHVIEGAEEIAVVLASGRAVPARVIGTDPETDLAVLKVNARDLSPITFAESVGIEVGDVVLAIGDPFGVGQTVTQGIVSATGRNRVGINTFENFIQTDAAINPGNSGGALVDAAGNLIGINTAILSPSGGSLGIGFAIPADMARDVMEQIIKQGRVERGWLGVQAQDLPPALARELNIAATEGALIAGVLRGGPADRGGLQPGDVITQVDGKRVADAAVLIGVTAAAAPGATVGLVILRNGEEVRLSVQLGRRPPMPPSRQQN